MHWYENAFFYHIFPLGFCGAPAENDLSSPPAERLTKIVDWIPHLTSLGATAIYLGPVFESRTHGYDTVDYNRIDRRLGTMESMRQVIDRLHNAGIRVVLDGVFHHVGRSFFAMDDLLRRQKNSPYRDWIAGVDFSRYSRRGDPFTYECWEGHDNLVKLNLFSEEVIDYLFKAVRNWITTLDIDGLRLDVAYMLNKGFLRRLSKVTREIKADFWLMGEVIHGDYRQFVGPGLLQSVTNYELYKGLYSSHNDRNYFEIAHSLDRQFGAHGLYRGMQLYTFVDNHDVNRVASELKNHRHLTPLYLLLFTVPGIPSIYYGSEWSIQGRKREGDDGSLRPNLALHSMGQQFGMDLLSKIRNYAALRKSSRALQTGCYETLMIASEQFVFLREQDSERVMVAVNSADQPESIDFRLKGGGDVLVEILDNNQRIPIRGGSVRMELPPAGGRVFRLE
jgi:cyclomaltodextrinase